MEYVDGRTVAGPAAEGHRLLPERSLEIIDGVLRALDYSLRPAVVHRDSAGNGCDPQRRTSRSGRRHRPAMRRPSNDTQTAQVIGTAQYPVPEQARGERVARAATCTSTGCAVRACDRGPPINRRLAVAIAYQHVRENPVPPSRVDPDVPPWAADLLTGDGQVPGRPLPDRRGHGAPTCSRRLRQSLCRLRRLTRSTCTRRPSGCLARCAGSHLAYPARRVLRLRGPGLYTGVAAEAAAARAGSDPVGPGRVLVIGVVAGGGGGLAYYLLPAAGKTYACHW